MNKENNKSAAGLRRSAIAERIRLREEWSELKGTPDQPLASSNRQHTRVLGKKPHTTRNYVNRQPSSSLKKAAINANVAKSVKMSSEVLVGVVALVEVGSEPRALALRAALGALGASVVPAWSPIVTHVVWAQGGSRGTRAKARALASRLVSPLWVEACAAANRRLPEHVFPAAARASDLPSPRTLRQLLKKAEMENITLVDLLSDDKDEKEKQPGRLRLSSETDADTSADTSADTTRDTTRNTSADTSRDISRDKTDVESQVNTAPRRALPVSISPAPPAKSRRKLFTQKEDDAKNTSGDESEDESKRDVRNRRGIAEGRVLAEGRGVSPRDRRQLARAERLARRLAAPAPPSARPTPALQRQQRPRIVLTGMGRQERQEAIEAIRALGGRVQRDVSWKTTHVLLGSCMEDNGNICSGNVSGVSALPGTRAGLPGGVGGVPRPRTLKALQGAARGARVLRPAWAVASRAAGAWLPARAYEVPHLVKISQKARIERTALCRTRSEYAYDVFAGLRVRVSATAPAAPAAAPAVALLRLCGAAVVEGAAEPCDMTLGTGDGEVSTKWVFDSVAAARMRTVRRYVNHAPGHAHCPTQKQDL